MKLRNQAAPLVDRVARLLEDPEAALAVGAALRAKASGAPDALVLAALLHQVGGSGVPGPGQVGRVGLDDTCGAAGSGGQLGGEPRLAAAWLGRTFGPAVAEPVRLLGDAARWLATVDRAWLEALDAPGLADLRAHGGPLGPGALRSFERRPYSADAVRLLRWIDAERRGAARPVGAPESIAIGELVELLGRFATESERLSA